MSWSKVLAVAAALLLAGALSGCFQPLYSEAAHPGLVDDLRGIEVAPIPNRVGHYLGENLIADLNGTGQTASPRLWRQDHRRRQNRHRALSGLRPKL